MAEKHCHRVTEWAALLIFSFSLWTGRERQGSCFQIRYHSQFLLRHELGGTSLVVQWLNPRSQRRGPGFKPWSRN